MTRCKIIYFSNTDVSIQLNRIQVIQVTPQKYGHIRKVYCPKMFNKHFFLYLSSRFRTCSGQFGICLDLEGPVVHRQKNSPNSSNLGWIGCSSQLRLDFQGPSSYRNVRYMHDKWRKKCLINICGQQIFVKMPIFLEWSSIIRGTTRGWETLKIHLSKGPT